MPDAWTKLLQKSGITKLLAKSGVSGDEMKERSKVNYCMSLCVTLLMIFISGCSGCVEILYCYNWRELFGDKIYDRVEEDG